MMENYLTIISYYLQAHTYMNMIFSFVVAFAESLPLVGTIIPSSITMSIMGILIGRGIITLDATIFWAALGALIGDTIGFFIGKYYNEYLRTIWPFKKYPRWLALGEDFFRKHGGKSILVGRFVGPVRSSVPLIAGLLKMTWFRFFVAAIPSVILWAIAYLLPGVLIGSVSLKLPQGVTTKFILIGFGIIILLWLLFFVIQRCLSFLATVINGWINRLWVSFYHHHSSHFLLRLISNRHILIDHHQLTMVLLALLSFIAFLILLIVTIIFGPHTSFNEPLFHFLQSLRLPKIDRFFIVITMFGDKIVIISTSLLSIIVLTVKKQWRSASHLLVITLLTGLIFYFLKMFVYSPRPIEFLIIDRSSSFPSGHMGFSVTILGFIAFLVAQTLSKKWRWVPYTLISVLIMLIGYSRLYLGAHWLEDVLASLFIGLTLLLLVIISYRRYPFESFGNLKWLFYLIIVIAMPWMSFTRAKFYTALHQYSSLWLTRQVSITQRWKHPMHYMLIYRMNRFEHFVQPFNIIQWATRLSSIKHALK
ncbi:bifunctional DedA family/phosphatase PAP2 family protein [Coxiella endosymbiont of Amblyomma nuttalli]|uniref:bifunctional DedA family/phosphatase PAP2 family protein n=1 Tax=Coxiella endosymbiont of Amblyomma nuttalli TaxID=2749996 RepID=UPI001BB6FA71|nr:bifunctional DedA family/phosphatase PAP2 family protein [Coxiella endosymbiont of Amblyomma nuttalli]QTS84051.1 Inner membrane protein YabI [Coxiella endosymbiont of Amblyomma nuttalli]